MKNFLLIPLLSILVLSCRKPSVEGETIHDRVFENNSSHSIKIKNAYFYDIELQQNESFTETTIATGNSLPMVVGTTKETDSLEVIFDDTLSVFHGSKNYTVLRNLRRADMYEFVESETNGLVHYTYTYTFTDADFEEADSIIN